MGVELILRWMHILGAVVLVGGTLFARLSCGAGGQTDEVRQYRADVRRKWSKWVGASAGLLLLSGLINLGRIISNYQIDSTSFPGSAYHPIFGVKFLLAFGVFFLSSVLAGKSSLAERLRKQEEKWQTLNLILAVAVVLLAGLLKVADRAPKESESPRPESTAVQVLDEATENQLAVRTRGKIDERQRSRQL